MRLIEFKHTRKRYDVLPAISFWKRGIIRFNQPAVNLLGLQAGDKVAFYQDADRPADWYVKKWQDGAVLRHYRGNKGLICNFSEVAKQILEMVKKDHAQIRLATLSTDGMYAILTKSI